MRKLHAYLCEIARKMKKNKITRTLLNVLKGIGLTRLVHSLFNLWYRWMPNNKQREEGEKNWRIEWGEKEKLFFSEHAQELKTVYDSLEDDRSRSVFENMLKYRATGNKKYLRKSVEKGVVHQYLVPELQFSEHEVIVDCGAFSGDTANLFYARIPGCKVIALEPDETNFEGLQKLDLEGLKPIKCGVWSEDTTLSFLPNDVDPGGGAISDSGNITIETKALDNLPECQSATYIKMDVEGAELEALKGARKIIKKNKPKLAICIYHKPQDFFEIPLYIRELRPDYKLFVYHHAPDGRWETVVYAV